MKKLTILFFMLIIPTTTISAPSISGVSGSGTYTISGSAFGAAATVLMWDDFEAHTTGTSLRSGTLAPIVSAVGNWDTMSIGAQTDDILISGSVAYSGSKSVLIEWDDTTINAIGWDAQEGVSYDTIYVSWMGRQSYAGDITVCNRKWYYLYGDSFCDPFDDLPQGMPMIPAGTTTWGYYNNDSMQPSVSNVSSDVTYGLGNTVVFADTNNVWNRWEYYQKLNTIPGCTSGVDCDGIIDYWIDSVPTYHRTDYRHRDCSGEWANLRLGHMWQENGAAPIDPINVWLDDVYVATSPARIEIGNNVDFNLCTHREIQVASSWSATSAEFTLRRGSFQESDSIYVFVIDSEGVPSDGFLLGSESYDLPTITGPNDFSTTSASVEIEGTYTVDSELTADTVTWTLGESSGFCVAALGVFSCIVPVNIGSNNILFEITDSNSGTASDSIVINRTSSITKIINVTLQGTTVN